MNLEIMLIAALLCGFVIFLQIQKFSNNPEISNDFSKYLNFCDAISKQIEQIKNLADSKDFLKQRLGSEVDKKDENSSENSDKFVDIKKEFLDQLDNFSREISFIKMSNLNRKSNQIWEEKLFEFLKKFENFIIENVQDGENLADKIRENLMKVFV